MEADAAGSQACTLPHVGRSFGSGGSCVASIYMLKMQQWLWCRWQLSFVLPSIVGLLVGADKGACKPKQACSCWYGVVRYGCTVNVQGVLQCCSWCARPAF
jgi:hypothetical protein